MREVTDEVKSALLSSFVPQTVTLVLFVDEDNFDIIDVPASRIINDSMRINWTTNIGDELRFGTVIAPELDFTLDNADGRYTTSVYKGEKVRVYCDVPVDGTHNEFILGNYYVETIKKQGKNLEVRALGALVQLDKIYNTGDITYPTTVWNFALSLCDLCNLQVKEYDPNDNVQNRGIVLYNEPEGGKYTCRQLLGYACEIMAVSADMTISPLLLREAVRLRWYSDTQSTYTEGNMFAFAHDDTAVYPTGVIINADERVVVESDEIPYVINNNPLMIGLDAYDLHYIGSRILRQIRNTNIIIPFQAETLPAPFLETMDICNFSSNGVSILGMISSITWQPNKNFQIRGVGYKTHDNDDFSPFTQQQDAVIDGMQTDISGQQTDITDIQSDVSTLQSDVDGLQGDVVALQTDVADLQTDVLGLQTDVDDLQTDVADIQTELSAIADTVTETGASGVWSWRKWSSGKIDLWASSYEITVGSGTIWGRETQGDNMKYYTGTILFPFALADNEYTTSVVRVSGSTCAIIGSSHTRADRFNIAFIIPGSLTPASAIYFDVTVHGTFESVDPLADEAIADESILTE